MQLFIATLHNVLPGVVWLPQVDLAVLSAIARFFIREHHTRPEIQTLLAMLLRKGEPPFTVLIGYLFLFCRNSVNIE